MNTVQGDRAIGHGKAPAGRPDRSALLLKGRLRTPARAAWLLIAASSVGLFLVGLPFRYQQLLATCGESACASMQLSPAEVAALGELELPIALYATYLVILATVMAAAYTTVALVIFWRRSDEWMALLAALWLVTFGTTDTYDALAASRPLLEPVMSFLDQLGWVVLLPLFLLTFPNGRFVPRWTRWLFPGFLALGLIGIATERLVPGLQAYEILPQLLWMSMMVTGVGAQVYRYRCVSDAGQRQQTKWVVAGLVAAVGGIAFLLVLLQSPLLPNRPGLPTMLRNVLEMTLVTAVFAVVALTIGYSILRYRLWDIDLIVNRTLIWGVLSAFVVGLYVLIVGAFGALFQSAGSFLSTLLATGIVALLFQPVRQRVQRGVNRLMYGERDDPYAVLSRLGRRLETTLSPGSVLSTIVETVAQTLKLPYVAVSVKEGEAFRIVTAIGAPDGAPLVLSLTYQGQEIGQLICGPRSGDRPFSARERRLLEDIARQAGVALHAERLAADVQRARARLVITREEERRRIRRDLHDGLGPALASQTLKIGSARALLRRDPEAADALLRELESDSKGALKDIRRLVYNLRPAALDELGLWRALQQDAPRQEGLTVRFVLPETYSELSAAVEVAVYRIVQEALTNVARHSGAANAVVQVEMNGVLHLTIADDGQGLPPDYQAGIGFRSMRERAEELGGTLAIASTAADGTTITVQLPLGEDE
ncbi:MAG: sensor histidine kinase [bacterium]